MARSMNAPFRTSTPATSPASPDATSSPASAAGTSPYASQISQLIAKFGREAVLVRVSARQASLLGLLTSGTSGPTGSISSTGAALQLSLASRLHRSLRSSGSTLFTLTWKVRVTPLGRPISALRASARRTSDSDCGSWPSPSASGFEASDLDVMMKRREECKQRTGNGNGFGLTLGQAALMYASWPTPTRQDAASSGAAGYSTESGRHSGTTLTDAARAAWPTPMAGTPAQKGYNEAGNTDSGRKTVALASWATPAARDFKSESATDEFNEKRWSHPRGKPLSAEATLASWATPMANEKFRSPEFAAGRNPNLTELARLSGPIATGSLAPTEKPGQLSPSHSRWLMGYPPQWELCAPTDMPRKKS